MPYCRPTWSLSPCKIWSRGQNATGLNAILHVRPLNPSYLICYRLLTISLKEFRKLTYVCQHYDQKSKCIDFLETVHYGPKNDTNLACNNFF